MSCNFSDIFFCTRLIHFWFTLQYVSQPRTVDDVAKKSQELTRRGSELFGSMPVAHLTALMESEKEKGSGTEEEEEEKVSYDVPPSFSLFLSPFFIFLFLS